MTDFFNYLYFCACKDEKQGVIYSIIRFIIRYISNLVLPIQYIVTANNKKYRIPYKQSDECKIVVSLTSFPARINDLWKVIESLLRQTYRPEAIVLWLSKEQFNSVNDLPYSLVRLQDRGLIIKFCDGDLRSHKKYYYMIKEMPNTDFIIVDDDVFYHSKTIECLVRAKKEHPQCIIANHTSLIAVDGNKISPYLKWNNSKPWRGGIESYRLLPIGVGGVLYSSSLLHSMVTNSEVFMDVCPKADDLWLKAMALLNGTSSFQTKNRFSYLPVDIKNNQTLFSTNSISGNDLQLVEIIKKCTEILKHNPFEIIFE